MYTLGSNTMVRLLLSQWVDLEDTVVVERCIAHWAYGLHCEPSLNAFPMKNVNTASISVSSGSHLVFQDLVQTNCTYHRIRPHLGHDTCADPIRTTCSGGRELSTQSKDAGETPRGASPRGSVTSARASPRGSV